MVILVNFSNNPFKVQYRDGSKAFVKVIPSNKVVAMKGLRVSEQITNRASLAGDGVTIYDYERGTYYNNNGASYNNLPFVFVGNNIKQSTITNVNLGYTGSTTVSGATFAKISTIATPTTYTFTITANTNGTAGTITATTVGNNIFIGFKGNTTAFQLVSGLTANTAYNALGITTTSGSSASISASTFSVAATISLPSSSYYAHLQGLV
jgi:hypothetical protein